MFRVEEDWFKKLGRPPHELLEKLTGELPEAQQREEEHRIELTRRATGEASWDVPMALAWMRSRDVELLLLPPP